MHRSHHRQLQGRIDELQAQIAQLEGTASPTTISSAGKSFSLIHRRSPDPSGTGSSSDSAGQSSGSLVEGSGSSSASSAPPPASTISARPQGQIVSSDPIEDLDSQAPWNATASSLYPVVFHPLLGSPIPPATWEQLFVPPDLF